MTTRVMYSISLKESTVVVTQDCVTPMLRASLMLIPSCVYVTKVTSEMDLTAEVNIHVFLLCQRKRHVTSLVSFLILVNF